MIVPLLILALLLGLPLAFVLAIRGNRETTPMPQYTYCQPYRVVVAR